MKQRLALVTIALVLYATPLSAEWYVSNAIATTGEQITAEEVANHRYVLSIENEEGVEIQTLIVDGVDKTRTEIRRDGSGQLESAYQDDELSRLRQLDPQGLLLWEELFSAGELQERREYSYTGLAANLRSVYGSTGALLFREQFNYWRDGTLRSVVRFDADDTRTEYRYRDGQLQEEWISRGTRHERFKFDSAGRMVQRELMAGSQTEEQETRRYWGADSSALLQEVVIAAGPDTTIRRHDEAGRLVEETKLVGDSTVLRRLRVYDETKLLTETEYRDGQEMQWSYEYVKSGEDDGDHQLSLTRYFENGILVKTTLHITNEPGITQIEDLYRAGQIVLRVRFAKQQRISEEVFVDGVITRTRVFGGSETGGGQ